MQQAGLKDLAQALDVSRMAVHKHLALLQERGLVESVEKKGHVGRPKLMYQLTRESKTIFPRSYGAIATHAYDFIERNMGKEGIEKVLRERQSELFEKYYRRLENLEFDKKVRELARIRDEEGYMAEAKKSGRKHTLFEYNCPIIHVAENHWEACSTESELFEKVLGADIETTHRAAKGDMICKFLIKERKEGYL
jgi:predicted ArsR family transcriptional regulator